VEDVNNNLIVDLFQNNRKAKAAQAGTVSTAPTKNIEVVTRYTDVDVKANPNKLYIFGDNVKRIGTGGQAQIRNNPNAMGIATKLAPSMDESAFMTDKDLSKNKAIIDEDIAKIKAAATGKVVVFPKDGLGTGLAKLKEKAPKTYTYLKQRLLEEFSFDNDKGIIISTAPTQSLDSMKQRVKQLENKMASKAGLGPDEMRELTNLRAEIGKQIKKNC
jgi:hypothetical protein